MSHISSDEVIENVRKASVYYQEIMLQLMQNQSMQMPNGFYDNDKSQEIATKVVEQFFEHPEKFMDINLTYVQDLQKLIADSVAKFTGKKSEAAADEESFSDRRFKDPAWQQSIYFDFIRKYYMISAQWMKNTVKQYDLDLDGKRFLEFTSGQFIDALSPSNFLFSNPEVIRESLESGMSNIASGMKNFLQDIKKSGGLMNISTTDKSVFHIGKNLASTKGKVVFQNDLMQLICYEPKEKTYKMPLFVLPPWINKYYILDLSENNSMIKWLVDNNFQVFLVSWVNPSKKLAHKNFEDYLQEGVIEPLEFIKTLGFDKVNALGYCIGGTLLSIALSYYKRRSLAQRGTRNPERSGASGEAGVMPHVILDQFQDDPYTPIASATFLTTLVDFANPGEIGALINKSTIDYIEKQVTEAGYLDGKYLSNSFSLIRANDLVWSYFVNNYLLGKSPAAFDILYWNSDGTNLPATMYIYYLKNMYIDNLLKTDGGLEMLGVKINLSDVDVPSFSLAAKSDHIALWQSVYDGVRLFRGDRTFCLTDAGHVAGVVNPATSKKYSHRLSDKIEANPNDWLDKASLYEGSWWNSWRQWLVVRSGQLEKSMNYKALKVIEEAPGSYVR